MWDSKKGLDKLLGFIIFFNVCNHFGFFLFITFIKFERKYIIFVVFYHKTFNSLPTLLYCRFPMLKHNRDLLPCWQEMTAFFDSLKT